ncbi:MAG TPA: sulfotransferase family protein [Anaerolineae bacterium]|nr:sulfotransferase [Caldilineae bacterium]HID34636.1 sulfotransferase family protein [Anaerolineae bacterium]
MRLFSSLFSKKSTPDAQPVVIVSGLPRSGTSMMMKMLEAGGMDLVIDGMRVADEDNPKGYYEFERVKQLDKGDVAWVADARGKAVKVISALLEHLPPEYEYKVLFMNRKMPEVLASQRKMLARRGERSDISDERLAGLLRKHVNQVKLWLAQQPNFEMLDLDYNAMLADPEPWVERINAFLGGELNARAMAEVVDPALYRNRAEA